MKRNRALTDLFEPGSTLAVYRGAGADLGIVRPDQVFNTESYSIGPARIKDSTRRLRWRCGKSSKSSNVGSSKIALLMQPQTLWQMFDEVGFGGRRKAASR